MDRTICGLCGLPVGDKRHNHYACLAGSLAKQDSVEERPPLDVSSISFFAVDCLLAGCTVSLTLSRGEKPKGFPRGELLSVASDGSRNYAFDPLKVLAWVGREVNKASHDRHLSAGERR